jgi:hypothetical protein
MANVPAAGHLAAQVLAVVRAAMLGPERVNPNGGNLRAAVSYCTGVTTGCASAGEPLIEMLPRPMRR